MIFLFVGVEWLYWMFLWMLLVNSYGFCSIMLVCEWSLLWVIFVMFCLLSMICLLLSL